MVSKISSNKNLIGFTKLKSNHGDVLGLNQDANCEAFPKVSEPDHFD